MANLAVGSAASRRCCKSPCYTACANALEELKKSGTEAAYFKNTPGIEDTRKWYANLGNTELKELEKKYGY